MSVAPKPNDDMGRHAVGAAIRRAMDRRGVSKMALARAIGTSPSQIFKYRRGDIMPTLRTAQKLSDSLLDDGIVQLVIHYRTRSCVICEREFIDHAGRNRKYCSTACWRLFHKGVRAVPPPDPHVAAIAAYCRTCEPDGICHLAACPLRAYSPLPYVETDRVDVAEQGMSGGKNNRPLVWGTERRARKAEQMAAYWTPERRKEHSDMLKNRARNAA